MQLPTTIDSLRQEVEQGLHRQLAAIEGPPELLEAMEYSLLAGGKRLRPVLVVAARRLFDSGLDPMPAAGALELVHTYSLIHDDLPAMDDDDLRRGRPTSHKRFGEALAILAGDALLTEAFGLVARAYAGGDPDRGLAVVAELARAAGAAGMVGGQVLDMAGEAHDQPALERLHRMKTGALMTAAVRCGGLLGGADTGALAALTAYGRQIGLAFQVADDVLDVVGDRDRLGKSTGKDTAQDKCTYPALLGLESARGLVATLCSEAADRLRRFDARADPLREVSALLRASAAA